MKENTSVNKKLYKIFIGLIKIIPNILALCKITSLILSFFGITSFMITCFGGTSILFLILLYLISFVFKFCGLYRMSLNYVTCITSLSIFDWYYKIPISLLDLYSIYAAITGVFIISWIVYWYTHRNNPKIDHIKQLCDRYICR